MFIALLILLFSHCCILSAQASPTETIDSPDSLLAIMSNRWEDLQDCTCVMQTYIKLDDTEQRRIFKYKFKKPKWIKTEIVSGNNVGAEILYNPIRNKVIASAGGMLNFINVPFSPANARVQSIRGHRMDNNHMGHIIERWIQYADKLTIDLSENDSLIILSTSGIDTMKYHGAYSERLYIVRESLFPRGFEQYDIDGELIHEVKLNDIKVNVGLCLEDFEM